MRTRTTMKGTIVLLLVTAAMTFASDSSSSPDRVPHREAIIQTDPLQDVLECISNHKSIPDHVNKRLISTTIVSLRARLGEPEVVWKGNAADEWIYLVRPSNIYLNFSVKNGVIRSVAYHNWW